MKNQQHRRQRQPASTTLAAALVAVTMSGLLLILSSSHTHTAVDAAGFPAGYSPPANFTIGGLFSMTDSGPPFDPSNPLPWDNYTGHYTDTVTAFLHQMKKINLAKDLLPNTQLFLDFIDDQGSESGGFFDSVKLFGKGYKIMTGPEYSSTAINAAAVAKVYDAPVITAAASSPVLANKAIYPNLMRICQNDAQQGAGIAWLAKYVFNWHRVALLYTNDPLGQAMSNKFAEAAIAYNITILGDQSFASGDTATLPMTRLRATGATVFIYLGQKGDWKDTVIPTGVELGMFNNQTAWYTNGDMVEPLVDPSDADYAADLLRRKHTQGVIALTPTAGGTSAYNEFVKTFVNRNETGSTVHPMMNFNPATPGDMTSYTLFAADLVNLIARALHQIYYVDFKTDFDSAYFFQTLAAQNFEGISGQISFDKDYERPGFHYTLSNLQGNNWVAVGEFTSTDYVPSNNVQIKWADGTSNVPLSEPVIAPIIPPSANLTTSESLGIMVTSIVSLAVIVLSLSVLFFYRRSRVMHVASPVMLSLILIGGALVISSVIISAIDQSPARCTAHQWLFNLGFTCAMCSMMLKTYRVHKIFNSKTLQVLSLSDATLLKMLLIPLLFDIVILALRSGIAPYQMNEKAVCTFESGSKYDAAITLTIILIVVKAAMIVFAAYLSFAVRNLPQLYNESTWLGVAIYNSLLICAAWVGIRYGVEFSDHPSTITVFESALILVAVAITLSLLFAPKFVDLYQSEKHRMFLQSLQNKRVKAAGGTKIRKNSGTGNSGASHLADESSGGNGSGNSHPSGGASGLLTAAGIMNPTAQKMKRALPGTAQEVYQFLEHILKDQQALLEHTYNDMENANKRAGDKKKELVVVTDRIFQLQCDLEFYKQLGVSYNDAEVAGMFKERMNDIHLTTAEGQAANVGNAFEFRAGGGGTGGVGAGSILSIAPKPATGSARQSLILHANGNAAPRVPPKLKAANSGSNPSPRIIGGATNGGVVSPKGPESYSQPPPSTAGMELLAIPLTPRLGDESHVSPDSVTRGREVSKSLDVGIGHQHNHHELAAPIDVASPSSAPSPIAASTESPPSPDQQDLAAADGASPAQPEVSSNHIHIHLDGPTEPSPQ